MYAILACDSDFNVEPAYVDSKPHYPWSISHPDLAKEDLANNLSVSVDDIKISNIEEVTWPTSALGYPKQGEQYLQVETPGFKIFLAYNNTIYEYHSDAEGTVVPPPEGKKQG